MIDHFKNLFSQMIIVSQDQIVDMGIFGTDTLMSLLNFLKFINKVILYVFKHTNKMFGISKTFFNHFYRSSSEHSDEAKPEMAKNQCSH